DDAWPSAAGRRSSGLFEFGALTGLGAGHLIFFASGVAELRFGRVADALQSAVDDIARVLVSVRVFQGVVVQPHRAVDVVAKEPEPEPVVAFNAHRAVDVIVLDRVPCDFEGTSKRPRAALDVEAPIDGRVVNL